LQGSRVGAGSGVQVLNFDVLHVVSSVKGPRNPPEGAVRGFKRLALQSGKMHSPQCFLA
jgi:hypothetical protein